jgi:PAS domain S-box-containing protein
LSFTHKKYRILHLEDSQSDADLVKRQLERAQLNFEYFLAKNRDVYIEGLDKFKPDVILCDHALPQFDSLLAHEIYHQKQLRIPFILVTGSVSEEYAVAMIKSGIDDYLLKTNLQRLAQAIQNALLKRENERKIREAESKLELNEKRFRAMIERSTDMKMLITPTGEKLYCSPSITHILGYSHEEYLLFPAFSLVHEDDSPHVLKELENLVDKPGKTIHIQFRMLHKNGSYTWCEGTVTNLLHEPAVTALVTNFRNVNEKKLAEQEKEFDRNNTKALINNTNDAMWSVDTQMRLITSNKPFDDTMLAISGSVVARGMNIIELGFSEKKKNVWLNFYERALTGETFTVIEAPDEIHDAWSEISFYPIRKGNNIIGTACYARDITERRKAERKLKQQYDQLSEIAFMLSHQARAPIASILGLLNLIKFDDIAHPSNTEVLSNLRKTTSMFDSVIHQIMQSTSEIEEINNRNQ